MASNPTSTFNALGNIRAAATLAASGNASYDLDFSTKFEGQIAVQATFGTVAATYGLKVEIFPGFDSTTPPKYASDAEQSQVAQPGGSTTWGHVFKVGIGKYSVKITNLDATNALTNVSISTVTADGMS